ncbi:MAG: HD-GYP domain-containing protein [Vicinamibacterales bacterium]|nr:HD-GYP domain-containing protein [Vicinamibacterales bacterium]
MSPRPDELVRRLAASIRAAELYAPGHPLVQRSARALLLAAMAQLQHAQPIIVAFLEGEVVVNDFRLPRTNATLTGLIRDMREREVEKITIGAGIELSDIRAFMEALADRTSGTSLAERLEARGVRRIVIGRLAAEPPSEEGGGLAMARQVYSEAVGSAEQIWEAAKAGEPPNPNEARGIIDSLSRLVSQDRTSLMALTALKRHDNYTFTHMVNVTSLAMALGKSLALEGPMLREFGFAALMHDIGKVHTPLEILNKPDKLTNEEFSIMKRHVVDGAHILRRTPDMPALAPVVAFEHHLKQDLSGYPEKIGARELNLCTMVVSIVDVFDALRSTRPYRQGMATDRIKAIMGQQDSPAFHRTLLRRFVNMMGLFPIGTLVRLNTDEMGVVTSEHPDDPFRPQVKLLTDRLGQPLESPVLANTWERNDRGDYPRAIVEAVDPDSSDIDPLAYL